MSSIIRTVTTRAAAVQASASSSSRCLTTSAILQAGGGGKGKGGTKPGTPAKKKASASYGNKVRKTGDGGSGGGGGSSSKTKIEIRYANAKPAPDLGDLPKLHPDAYAPLYEGKAVVIPRPSFDSIKKFGLPRKLGQELESSGGPASVVRKSTLEMASLLEKGKKEGRSRHMISGERGSGKSTLLLQATNYALQSGWIVVYVPSAIPWVDSSSTYTYDAEQRIFQQPALAFKLLEEIRAVNGKKVDDLEVQLLSGSGKLADGQEIKAGMKVSELAGKTGEAYVNAPAILRIVMDTLAEQTKTPVLFAVDEAQVLFDTSLYRTPDFVRVESYQLSMPLLALDFISGRKTLKSGSVLAAYSNTSPNWALTDTFSSALSLPTSRPITPYTPIQPAHLAHLKGLDKIEVPRCTPEEALGFFDIWRRKGWTHSGDEAFINSLSVSNGNFEAFGKSLRKTLQLPVGA